MNHYKFSSNFASYIEKFIAFKVASGFSRNSYEPALYDFDKWCRLVHPDEKSIDIDMIFDYCRIRTDELESSQSKRICCLRMLTSFMSAIGIDTCIVPQNMGRRPNKHIPYIFTHEELLRFFEAADSLEPSPLCPNKELVVPVMFRLMYCCGLRPQEVRNIRLEEVFLHESYIFIKSSKNRKDRIVALNDDMISLLATYIALMSIRQPHSTYLFERPEGGPYHKRWLSLCAVELAEKAGLLPHGKTTFRTYDLRHNFATAVITRWHMAHEDVDSKLVYLSEYMGHVNFDDTTYYITLIPEMYDACPQVDTAFLGKALPLFEDEEDFWNE